MNFDVAIIGGGLAGLTCGIALQQRGKRCVIINNGQAAIDFASGSLDLLSRMPDGSVVENINENTSTIDNITFFNLISNFSSFNMLLSTNILMVIYE